MNWYRKIATNTLFQIIARIASSGTTFLITLLIARHFGLRGYGDFAKVTAFITLFYLFADFGLNAVFLQKEDAKVRFKDLFYTRLVLSVILTFLVNVLAAFLPYNTQTHIGFSPNVRLGMTIFSFTLITEAILYTTSAVFQRELSYEYFMVSSVIGSIATLLFVLIATYFSNTLLFIYLSFILGGIVESGTALFFTKEGVLPPRIDTLFAKRLALETLPIALMLIFNLVYFRIDIILLSLMKPSQDVGIYDLSYKFFDFLIALPLFLSNALYPSIIQNEKIHKNFTFTIRKYMIIFAGFSFIVLVPTWLFAPLLQVINKEFIATVLPLRLLVLSLPIFFVTSILQWVLIAKKQQMFLAVIYFFSTVINVWLNLLLIPKYSYLASAVITGVSEAMVFIALWVRVFWVKEQRRR